MLIKVCPKSGERQSKNDFLLIFFYIQSKGAAQSSILMILRHPLHSAIARRLGQRPIAFNKAGRNAM